MTTYTPPAKDIRFILHDVLCLQKQDISGYADLDPDFTQAIVDEAGKIATNLYHPLNALGDRAGCTLENGTVRTPDGFKAAFDQMRMGGWAGLDLPEEYGGQNMPSLLDTIAGEIFTAANQSLAMYSGLTKGAAKAILAHGTDQQKQTYLPPMIACDWTGTMNLTESHCGTDLGLMRTRAMPQGDGSYKITGQKIFISSGEHDLAENIIHLVLAKIPDGPDGIKGVSLFIVPKFMVADDGTLGAHNAVECSKIENKMGIHGIATCVMDYDGATGFLLGQEHKGMRAMFTMMNEARLGVASQGLAQAEVAYQNAALYAKDRLQGRAATGPQNPDGPADPLIVHADIRRALLDQKSFIEGARAFLLWGSTIIDKAQRNGDADAHNLISILTPVLKGFLTDQGFEATIQAQQIYGGHGYINDTGMGQFARDARITMIYEGANGVQALDLVARKLGINQGKDIMEFFELIKSFCKQHSDNPQMNEYIAPLKSASKQLQSAALFFLQTSAKKPNDALAGSYDFMHLFGHVCMGYVWARMALAAHAALDAGTGDAAFYKAKIITAQYYMQRHMPKTALHLARIESGSDAVMALTPDAF